MRTKKQTLRNAIAFGLLGVALTVPASAQWNDVGTAINTTDNVGIGIPAGTVPLFVGKTGILLGGTTYYVMRVGNTSADRGFLLGYDDTTKLGLISSSGATSGLTFWTHNGSAFGERIRVAPSGNVGIGTSNPTVKLDVAGDVNVSGNIAAKYQDVAEWVPATTDMEPGMVVVLNPDKSNEVMLSGNAYDTTVAGVVSAQPGVILGEAASTKEMVATTGRVKVKVDATQGAIKVGDLLVTSSKPGVAMRSEPINVGGAKLHRPGTIIGKALEPLPNGQGEILVLLSMQ